MLLQVVTQLGVDTDPHGDRRAPGRRGPRSGVDRLLRRGRPAGPRAARRAGRLAAFPWDRLADTAAATTCAAPGGHGAGRAVRGADQRHLAQRAGEDLLRDHQVVADGEPARAVHPRRPGDAWCSGSGSPGSPWSCAAARCRRAYAALKGEVDERRVAEEALRQRGGSAAGPAGLGPHDRDRRPRRRHLRPALPSRPSSAYRPEDFLELPLLGTSSPRRAPTSPPRSRCSPSGRASSARRAAVADPRRPHPLGRGGVPEPGRRPGRRGLVWNGRDVTERKALESELNHRATTTR